MKNWSAVTALCSRMIPALEVSRASRLEIDLRSARLERATIKWPAAFRRVARLSERYSATTGTRSLDILHVAAAKSLRAVEFISFEGRQRALASANGLIVTP